MDWRKLVSQTGVQLRGKVVLYEQIEGEVGQLLQQHFDVAWQQELLSNSYAMAASIAAHTGHQGLGASHNGYLSETKNYLQFVCADSRVVPSVMETGEHFIISASIAGESLGGAFAYKQIVDLLPALDGIIIEAHTNCGACAAANAAREGQTFDGSLKELMDNVDGDIDHNLLRQVNHLYDRVGRELLRQHQVAVLGVKHDIFATDAKAMHAINEKTVGMNDLSLTKVNEAVEVFRSIISAARDKRCEAAQSAQHPKVLWLSGLTIFGQFRRGIGCEHELVNDARKGLIFKVLWQNPHDVSTVASARYILDHGDSVKQIVFSASSERDLWWDIESFVNNSELATYLIKHPGTELIGLVINDDGICASDRVVNLKVV